MPPRRVAELDSRVRDLDAEVSAAEAALGDAQQRLDTAEEQLRTAHERADDLQRQLAAARDELRRRAVATYVAQQDSSPANFFTGVKTLGQMDAALGYASTVLAA